jgi:hypothetical protein
MKIKDFTVIKETGIIFMIYVDSGMQFVPAMFK